MVMEYLIKCGVRVHGGNGNGTFISKKRQISCWNTSLGSFYLPVEVTVHYLRYLFRSYFSKSVGIRNLMFNDEEKEWPWTERVVSSEYACTYYLGLSCHPRTGKACIF